MIWRSGYRCFRRYRQCFFLLAAYCGFCLGSSVPDYSGPIPGRDCPAFLSELCPRTAAWSFRGSAIPHSCIIFARGKVEWAAVISSWQSNGLVLGLPASLTASCLGLTGFVMYGCMVCLWNRFKGKRDKEAFPVGPFLAGGAAAVYCMRLGGWMI